MVDLIKIIEAEAPGVSGLQCILKLQEIIMESQMLSLLVRKIQIFGDPLKTLNQRDNHPLQPMESNLQSLVQMSHRGIATLSLGTHQTRTSLEIRHLKLELVPRLM